jgi:hypothetical protein
VRIGRNLALIVALAAMCFSLTACDTSPYAAQVNGHAISVAYFENQLKQWSSNRSWVTSFDSQNSRANGGNGATVAGTGGSGTYSTTFAAAVLDTIIESDIVNGYLSSHGQLPTADELVASRAVNKFLRSSYWDQFSASLRQFLVQQLADQAVLAPLSADQATIQSAYGQIEPYLFSRICFHQVSAFNQSDALAIVSSGIVDGAHICLDQAGFEAEPAAFQSAVIALTPGQISQPIRVSYGYVVVELVSKTSPGLSPGVQKVLSAATANSVPAPVADLILKAHVKVNPQFGTWSRGQIMTPPPLVASS